MKHTLRHMPLPPRIAGILLQRLWQGEYAIGTQLPSVAALSAEFDIGRHSVEAALRLLARQGWVKLHPGRLPLTAMPRRIPGVHRIALLDIGVGRKSYSYENAPRGWLYMESVRKALARRRQDVTTITDNPEKILPEMIDGLIVFDFSEKFHADAIFPDVPLLKIHAADLENAGPNTIVIDRNGAIEQAAVYLIAHGIQSVVSLQRGGDSLHSEREKRLGRLLAEYNPALGNMPVLVTHDVLEHNAVRPMERFLKSSPPLPLGVLAQGDLLARDALRVAMDAGLEPKRDILVIGCTGLPEAAHWQPSITTIASPFDELGEVAAESMMKLIAGSAPLQSRRLTGKFTIHES